MKTTEEMVKLSQSLRASWIYLYKLFQDEEINDELVKHVTWEMSDKLWKIVSILDSSNT